MPGKRLSLVEREFLSAGRRDGLSFRAIGRELGRPHTTLVREWRRNLLTNRSYRPSVADHRTQQRAKRPKPCRLSCQVWLARRVEALLARKWSPAQISAQFRRDHLDDPRWWVSPEAIYQWIYVQGQGPLRAELTRHLKLARRARQSGNRRGQLPDRVHISQRPLEAIGREVPGHWEGDLILGAGGRSQVGMITERTSRYTVLFALPEDRTAVTFRDALIKVVRTLPKHLRRSLTWDNGKEMAEHVAFTVATDVQVYFADPGRPWQRGTAEHTIGMLRAYLPKGQDLSGYSTRDLNAIGVELNRRPRKMHNWRSPAELYAELLVQ